MSPESLTAIALICGKAPDPRKCIKEVDACYVERTSCHSETNSGCSVVFYEADVVYHCLVNPEPTHVVHGKLKLKGKP